MVVPPALGFTGDKGPLPPDSQGRSKLFKAVDAGAPVVFDVELVSALDDLLDRGEYDDLDVQEATEYARVFVQQKRESEAAAANAATEALIMPAP